MKEKFSDVTLNEFAYVSPKCDQCARKVMSHSKGLVDFAVGLVNTVLNLPDGLMNFF